MSFATYRLVAYVGVLAGVLAAERSWPFAPKEFRKTRRLAFHLGIAAANTAVLTATLAPLTYLAAREAGGWGLAGALGLEGWVEVGATMLVLDLWDYWMHLANHRIPLLWRFHKAHHSDMEVDVTTASRFHLGELLITGVSKILVVLAWGPSLAGLVAFETLLTASSQFHHGNLGIPLKVQGVVETAVVTPRMHRCHHALGGGCVGRNFSTIFSFWDRLFRSYHLAADLGSLRLVGLPAPRGPATMELRRFLLTPVEA